MKNIVITLLFVTTLFSCDIADEDAISTQDLLLGKWQLETFSLNGIQVDNECKLNGSTEFNKKELVVHYFSEDSLSNCEEELITSDYTIEGDIIKTSIPSSLGTIENITILDISMTDLKTKYIVTFNGAEVEIKEKYTKIN